MKKHPYTRQILIFFLYILMWVLNFFISPVLFILGKTKLVITNTENGKISFWSWFINIDEPTVKENMYGDEGYLERKGISDIEERNVFVRFYWHWIWSVIRNSFFYFKLHIMVPIPKVVPVENIKVIINTSGKGDMEWCTWGDNGKIHVEYTIDDVKYFRYSETKIVKFLFFWKRERKMQFGASGIEDKNRYIFKINYRKTK